MSIAFELALHTGLDARNAFVNVLESVDSDAQGMLLSLAFELAHDFTAALNMRILVKQLILRQVGFECRSDFIGPVLKHFTQRGV